MSWGSVQSGQLPSNFNAELPMYHIMVDQACRMCAAVMMMVGDEDGGGDDDDDDDDSDEIGDNDAPRINTMNTALPSVDPYPRVMLG